MSVAPLRTFVPLLLFAHLARVLLAAQPGITYCYYESTGSRQPGRAQFNASSIPAGSCTHLVYRWLQPTQKGLAYTALDIEELTDLSLLRASYVAPNGHQPQLLVAIGGPNGANVFDSIGDAYTFAYYAQLFMLGFNARGIKLDGFELDWRITNAAQGVRFSAILVALNVVTFFSLQTLVAVVSGSAADFQLYDVDVLMRTTQLLSIATFDYHPNATQTSLYASAADVDASVKLWTQQFPPSRLLLGIPFKGYAYSVKSGVSQLGGPVLGPAAPGPFRGLVGQRTYAEVCEALATDGAQQQLYLPSQMSAIAFGKTLWMSYDDPQSVQNMVVYARGKQLAGVAAWSVDMDDLQGQCHGGSLPLLNAIAIGWVS